MTTKKFIGTRSLHPSGITLIELVIVMALIAILAAIAYPTYTGQIRKSQRAVAKSVLLNAANRQEQYFFDNRQYADAMNKLTGYTSAVSPTILFNKSSEPTTASTDALYAVSVAAVDAAACGTAPCFELQAVPQNDQANDDCGTFTITSSNVRDVSNTTGTAASECW
ncbi:MAG: type IV pilin protein [Gammaproteobacteria bacterium]